MRVHLDLARRPVAQGASALPWSPTPVNPAPKPVTQTDPKSRHKIGRPNPSQKPDAQIRHSNDHRNSDKRQVHCEIKCKKALSQYRLYGECHRLLLISARTTGVSSRRVQAVRAVVFVGQCRKVHVSETW
eukprot:3532810-Rhodomonas_salina.7